MGFVYSEIRLSLIYTTFLYSLKVTWPRPRVGQASHSGERKELMKSRSTYSKLSVEMPRETPEANLVKKT